jgi:CxxC-x17-CxxC domain-containing protein
MPFEDKKLICEECGQEFVHSAEDQARYAERGFTHEPKRCRECREKRRADAPAPRPPRPPRSGGGERGERGGGRGGQARESYEAVCAACGATTTVPFKPSQGRPVYCRDCYRAKKR